MRAFLIASLLVPAPAAAGLLTAGGVAVLDGNSAPRTAFTNTERVTFQQKVHNGAASAGRVSFAFTVLSPAGAQVFRLAGNTAPGTVGNSATQLAGLPVSRFYSTPGVYTLQAEATLDAQTISQQATFVVSSPSILLIYPPNGAQGVADIPLTFRWSSSGAATYRVVVGDNPSFYNSVYTGQTAGSEAALSYPVNPADPRQRLAAGQLYYWKVEGLDASGQKVAESPGPYSFGVQTAALTRDMAVTELSAAGAPDAQGAVPFRVSVKNQGGAAQAGAALRFSVGGLPAPGTPVTLPMIAAGEARDYSFSAPLPPGQSKSLAVACVELSDDNLNNNCRTLLVDAPPPPSKEPIAFGDNMTPEQIWQAIQAALRERGVDLSGYGLVNLEGQLSGEELKGLLESLRGGQAEVAVSGPKSGAAPGPSPLPGASSGSGAPKAAEPAASSSPPLEAGAQPGMEWAGIGTPWGPQSQGLKAASEEEWRKVWKRLHYGRPPKVDFESHMVVGVVGGREDGVERIAFDSTRMSLSGLLVRYSLGTRPGGPRRGESRDLVPFSLRVLVKSSMPVKFELEREDAPPPAVPRKEDRQRT